MIDPHVAKTNRYSTAFYVVFLIGFVTAIAGGIARTAGYTALGAGLHIMTVGLFPVLLILFGIWIARTSDPKHNHKYGPFEDE